MPSDRKPSMYELRGLNRKLQVMNEKINGPGALAPGEAEEKALYEVDEAVLRNMSPFEQEELKLAMALRKFRDTMEQVGDESKGRSGDEQLRNVRLTKMRQSLRKQEMELKPMQRAMINAAHSDDEKRRCKEALGHLNNMRKRYDRHRNALQEQAFGRAAPDVDGRYDNRGPAPDRGNVGAPMLESIDDVGRSGIDLREDEEFALFFDQIAKQDQRIDQALDRIYAGTLQLKQNAMTINQELKVQNQLLTETENKVADATERIESLNKRVRKAVKSVESDRMCMYMICFILLLGLTGFILYQLHVIKK